LFKNINRKRRNRKNDMEEDIKKEEAQEKSQEKAQEEAVISAKELNRMTVKDLREMAKDIPGVAGVHAMKKDEVLAIIKEYRGITDEEPVKKAKKKIAMSKQELKAEILRLREEKQKARENRDRQAVDVLRRRINRLKKRSRKIVAA